MADEPNINPTEEFLLLQKILDMMEYAYTALRQFPKSEKYAMATDIKHCMNMILRYAIEARKHYYKKTTLQNMDVEIATLRVFIRLSYRLHFIDMAKYDNWSTMVDEIGRMLGGWLKTVKQPKPPA
ncbi:MAG: diversity-generating retroelement protein Avd [Oscillospiraceae bacterium]|nr:diversity-generating retroelement protein Avd [Oscillospiraceae bacterium]